VPVTRQQIQRMMSLFRGYERKSGTHGVPDREPGALKWNIKRTARWHAGPTTDEMWRQHLEGERPLGIVPIREDSSCVFGSVDYDEYDVDLVELIQRVETAKFPLVPVRSKSGGLHLFLFLSEPEPAADVQSVLRDAAAALGVAECEIFPKQTAIAADRGDSGSWMIVPYFGGDYEGKLQRQHGLKPRTGADMTLTEFLAAAERARTSTDVFARLLLSRVAGGEKKGKRARGKSPCDFSDGPPCLQHLAGNGHAASDGRKRILFMIGIYLKRADPEGWTEKLEVANQRFSPPLPASEVNGVIKSLKKKDYEYQCKEEPFRSHCNSALCRTRKHGVGLGGEFPQLELRKLDCDPPIWFADVEGKTVELGTEELLNYSRFLTACAIRINKIYRHMQQPAWLALVGEAMERMQAPMPAPEDAGERGRFRELLEEFLTNRSRGTRREDLLSGRPWEDSEEKRHYFTLRALQRHLTQEGMRDVRRGQMTLLIRNVLRGGHHSFNFGNTRGLSCWWVPSDAVRAAPEVDAPDPGGDEV
jgi:hypothetical protein